MPSALNSARSLITYFWGASSEFWMKEACIILSNSSSKTCRSASDIFSRSDWSQSCSQSCGTATISGLKSIKTLPTGLISRSEASTLISFTYSSVLSYVIVRLKAAVNKLTILFLCSVCTIATLAASSSSSDDSSSWLSSAPLVN